MGATRFETAVGVAEAFFSAPAAVGVANGFAFPDALSGGAHVAGRGGPLLLTGVMTAVTRRRFLAGAAAVGAVPLLPGSPAVADVERVPPPPFDPTTGSPSGSRAVTRSPTVSSSGPVSTRAAGPAGCR